MLCYLFSGLGSKRDHDVTSDYVHSDIGIARNALYCQPGKGDGRGKG